jgi:DNA processing protein
MHDPTRTDKNPWIALNMARQAWPALHKELRRQFAFPEMRERVLQQGMTILLQTIPGLSDKLTVMQQSHEFAAELEHLHTSQTTLLTFLDPFYPPALRWIPEPPLVLYMRGTLHERNRFAVAVVGSRKPTNYGKAAAQRLSTALAQHGYTVVSGLARGVDSQAHHGALQAGGETLAVLGSGLNVIYPPENRRLFERITAQGAVLSEFPFDTKPDRWNFPRRNRLISGLSLGTLVIEAAASSGALHTARHALEQGREVFAVPGRIDAPNSRGTNGLIKGGAKLVERIEDILEEFPETIQAGVQAVLQSASSSEPPQAALAPHEVQVLALLHTEETHIDTLIQASQLPAHVVASILMTLELRGLIQQFPGKFFARHPSVTGATFDERD